MKVCDLKNGLKSLEYLVQVTQEKASSYEFFDHLSNYIVPFIKASKELEGLKIEWDRDERDHATRLHNAEKNAIKEVNESFKVLTTRINASKTLFKKMELRQLLEDQLIAISSILKSKDKYSSPPYYEEASDKLCDLCSLLIEEGHQKLVKEMVTIEQWEYYDQQNEQIVSKPIFSSASFAESASQRRKELSLLQWQYMAPWVVWKYFRLAEECWHLDNFKIEIKRPKNQRFSDCHTHVAYLIEKKAYWIEMQAIKNRNFMPSIQFFKVERFRDYLKNFMSSVITYHEGQLSSAVFSSEIVPCPYSLALRLHINLFLLDVEWHQGGQITSYLLQSFKEESNPYLFFKTLLAQPGKTLDLADFDMHTASVAKLIDRANLKGPLKGLFFSKHSTRKIILKSKHIFVSRRDFELKKYIESLNLEKIETLR